MFFYGFFKWKLSPPLESRDDVGGSDDALPSLNTEGLWVAVSSSWNLRRDSWGKVFRRFWKNGTLMRKPNVLEPKFCFSLCIVCVTYIISYFILVQRCFTLLRFIIRLSSTVYKRDADRWWLAAFLLAAVRIRAAELDEATLSEVWRSTVNP